MLKLHHSGFIVKDIDSWEKNMLYEEKVGDVIDPAQNARLTLYKNFGSEFIELIQPLNETSFTWNSLEKWGDHFNHFCYTVDSLEEMEQTAVKYKLISILAPLPALLFNGKMVAFYYARNRQVVEFLINNTTPGKKTGQLSGAFILDSGTFRNGIAILETRIKEDWIKAGEQGTPAWCYYGNDHSRNEGKGKLYNWHAVNDSRGLAPEGFHIPTKGELYKLIQRNGGKKMAGEKMKKLSGWESDIQHLTSPSEPAWAGNIQHSETFPSGYRDHHGEFYYADERYFFWSSTERNSAYACSLYLFENKSDVSLENTNKASGFSVLCIKD